MISEVIMPDLGATGSAVLLEEWQVEPGDRISAGQALCVVTTDKATVEVEAFRDGVVLELRAAAGERIELGEVIALLADASDEVLSPTATAHEPELKAAPPNADARRAPDRSAAFTSSDRILASPLARRIAREEGLDLHTVEGSGRQGQILKRDVLQALDTRERQESPEPGRSTGSRFRQIPLTPMRRAIAERTQRSKAKAPHFYAQITVDMRAAQAVRQQAGDWAEQQGWAKPTLTDICIRAAALALEAYPVLNSSFQGDEIRVYDDINIGVVVGLPDGMLIPVVRHANRHNLYTLAAITNRLKERVTGSQMSQSDMTDGTFTLSNLGMFGLDSFTAVINPPEAAILALGAVQQRPAARGGQLVIRPLMTATLSVDHRVTDGIIAARFIELFKDLLENPIRLTLDGPKEVSV